MAGLLRCMSNDASTTSRGQVGLFALATGQTIGRYTITAVLGQGGFGITYRARDGQLNRDVAIKVLPALVSDDPDRLMRFEREAQALASLNHPHIAVVFEIDDADGTTFIAMWGHKSTFLTVHLTHVQTLA